MPKVSLGEWNDTKKKLVEQQKDFENMERKIFKFKVFSDFV